MTSKHLIAALLVLLAAAHAAAGQVVEVREERGVYRVFARFTVEQPASVVMTVLTDYEQIPRFMPNIRTSIVRERGAGRAVVEQSAVASVLMFSRRVHLVLDIEERPGELTFEDRCGGDFDRYRGAWRLTSSAGQTEIVYELTAEPRFGVPGFLLKRLLQRDSTEMISRLQAEVAARAAVR